MRTASKVGILAFCALLPLLMAPSGGFPSRPQFQSVGIGTAAPAAGIQVNATAGPIATFRRSGAALFDFGGGLATCGGTYTADSFGLCARPGNPVELGVSGGAPTLSLTATAAQLTGNLTVVNSAGPIATFRRGVSAIFDFGGGLATCGGTYTADSFGLCARPGNPVEIGISGGAPTLTITATGAQLNGVAIPKRAFGQFDLNGVCTASAGFSTQGITGCVRNSAGNYTVNVTAAGFTSVPVCTASIRNNGFTVLPYINASSATSVIIQTITTAGANTDALVAGIGFMCEGT